ncbi:nitrite reductase small subunit NirD [Halomonas sp. QX-2]|jgi:nitrite reductase (NADH) small subunit|uniref:Nitrite reductase small subunit NirD n=1 Tax=Vreelandella sedimenti TaxID=2729618 RepID=A0A7Z0SM33_9GAMM|nr:MULTISPECIES: nitrite reductase small subunit NirD [Halomonas]NYT73222.1 nitrite reductase small subunit NirD [Halomonas sedimenti]|tara:strand:- start:350 stop:787 length:438 start_codon:yes stop_codon:yes gene_type:complete
MTGTALKKEMDMADIQNSEAFENHASENNTAWQKVCTKADLVAFSGVAAWLETADGPAQVAIFYLPGLGQGKGDELFALDHHDPFSNANVIARGIVGDLKGAAVVASPIYKQHFRLEDGQCLEDEDVKLRTWKVKFKGDEVWVEG